MPFFNEHAVTIGRNWYEKYRRESNKETPGVSIIWGVKGGGTGGEEMASIRFAKDKFTPEEARLWLMEKKISFEPDQFEEALRTDGVSDGETRAARFDRGTVGSVTRKDDGSLSADAVVTRSGVFTYRNADGSTRRELRHPDHIFRLDSLETMKMIPVTNGHPNRFVTPKNVKALKVGHTGENIRPDGHTVRATLVIDADEGIRAVDNGRKELSLGYDTTLVKEDGVYKGERYDYVQTNIRYNHLALVDRARAGHEARLNIDGADVSGESVFHFDGADAVEIDSKENKSTNQNKRSDTMPKLVLNGIQYDAAQEVINAHEAEKARADKFESDLSVKTDELTKVTAERDDLKDKVDKLEKIDHTDAINEQVSARIGLIEVGKKVLDEETQKNIDNMSNIDIQKAVIIARSADADQTSKLLEKKVDSDGKPDIAYIGARYDSAIDGLDKENKDSGVGAQRRVSTPRQDGQNTDENPADKARQDMIDNMCNPNKGEEKK